MRVFLLVVALSTMVLSESALFASSFDGSVFSINLTTLQPSIIAVPMPGADSTNLAISNVTGEGIACASGAAGQYPLFANFNVLTGSGGTTAAPTPTPNAYIGPFYDPVKDIFFIFVSMNGALNYATIDQQTLNITMGSAVSFSASQQVPRFNAGTGAFSNIDRVACSLTDDEFLTCIDVDKLVVTRQTPVPNCQGTASCSFLTFGPSLGFVLVASSNYANGCASSVSASLVDGRTTSSRYLGGGPLTQPSSVCTFNGAAFSTSNNTYVFGTSPVGYAVISHKIGAPVTYVTVNLPSEFVSNVETFFWSN